MKWSAALFQISQLLMKEAQFLRQARGLSHAKCRAAVTLRLGKIIFQGICAATQSSRYLYVMSLPAVTRHREMLCDEPGCDYKTTTKGNLAVHMRRHSSERPFDVSSFESTKTRKRSFTQLISEDPYSETISKQKYGFRNRRLSDNSVCL